jgi:transcription antitermination factor NusG
MRHLIDMSETACHEESQTAIQRETLVEQVIEKEWYAVYTVVRHEKRVNYALQEKDIETFLPLREQVSQWKDRKKIVHFPLFPGYLFVNSRLVDRWKLLNTRGVVRILGINGAPIPVPVEQIEAIKRLLESKLKFDPYAYLAQGKEVVVAKGPLQGITGRILERRGDYRLILSVDMIRRSVSAQVDIRDVESA